MRLRTIVKLTAVLKLVNEVLRLVFYVYSLRVFITGSLLGFLSLIKHMLS